MIIPVGTSLSRKRLPWVTIVLILANAVVFAITHPTARNDDMRIYRAAMKLYEIQARIEMRLLDPGESEDEFEARQEAFWERFAAGEVLTPTSPEFLEWKQARERFDAAQASHVFQRYGFRRSHADPVTLVLSMFLHGGWMHLIFNMVFLWTVGVNMEDVWGRGYFLLLYFLCGTVAALAQLMMQWPSDMPCIGASGAVSAAMGAFMVRHFNAKIRLFVLLGFVGVFFVRARIILPLWFGFQLLGAFGSEAGEGGVAFWAHVGGFVLGAGLGLVLKAGRVEERSIRPQLEAEDRRRDKARALEEAQQAATRGEVKAQLEALGKALRADPDDLELRRRKLTLHQLVGERENAVAEGSNLLKTQWRLRDRPSYIEYYRWLEGEGLTPDLPPVARYRLAVARSEDAPHEAATLLWQLAETHPADPVAPRALALYADLLERLQQPTKADQVRALLIQRYPEAARSLRLEPSRPSPE